MSASSALVLIAPGLPAMLRAAGAAALAPAFTGMPGSMRVAVAVAAACIAWPLGMGAPVPEGSWWSWAPGELLAGACIGGVAVAAVQALRLAGRVAGEQLGLAMGETYGPAGAAEGTAADAMLGWAGAAAFVAVGGVEGVVLAAVRATPEDGRSWLATSEGLARTLDAGLSIGLRVCLPVLAVTLAGAAIGGVVVRAAPRLVVVGGGFGARAAVGLGTLAASAAAAWGLQGSFARSVLDRLLTGATG